jgi:hypothetical protein
MCAVKDSEVLEFRCLHGNGIDSRTGGSIVISDGVETDRKEVTVCG